MDFTRQRTLGLCLLAAVSAGALVGTASAESWRGLTVAPEHRCSPYDKKRDYLPAAARPFHAAQCRKIGGTVVFHWCYPSCYHGTRSNAYGR